MGANGNRILMALLTGVVLIWTVRFFLMDGHIFFHEQKAGEDYEIIGQVDGGPVAPPPAVADSICQMLAGADIEIGATIAKANCAACHQFDNAIHGQGPHLVGLVGRDYASTDFSGYSSALKSLTGQWDEAALNQFLFKPSAYVPGTAMNFAGWDNSKIRQRANVVAYLYSLSGAALPACDVATEDSPAEETSMEEDSMDETSMDEDATVEDVAAEDLTSEDVASEEGMSEEATTEETTTEDAAAEDSSEG